MTTRTATLDFRDSGTQQATGRVIQLADALALQERRARELSPTLQHTSMNIKAVEAVSLSATAKISGLTNTIGPLGAGIGSLAQQAPLAARGLLAMVAAGERATLMSKTLNAAMLGGLGVMTAGAVAALAYADNALRAADNYSALHARIRTFTAGQVQAAQVERDLFDAARRSRTSIADTVTLYTRLAPAVKDYGHSQEDALRVTELTTKALAIQGADIREQAAATVQFSQAIASGVLRGDELRSLLESSPQLMRYIAQNLEVGGKMGVAFSQLRNLGKQGKLTTDMILDALLRAEPQIEKDFVNAPKTAQQQWVVLKDQMTRAVGTLDKVIGGQQAVVHWLSDMATKADEWRQKMLLDPHALDPVREAGEFVGDAVSSIGQLGEVAVHHFDLIVEAGRVIIALKLGEVFANWFASAARGAQAAIGNLKEFQQTARFQAGATLSPAAADAAKALRQSALAADLRASELAAQAEIKVAQATAARAAADKAAIQAALAKADASVTSRQAAIAEAEAQALDTAATRAEEQAKKAQTAATAAATAATARYAVAQEAEAAVTAEVTGAVLAKNAAMKIAGGLYGLVGGGVGILTLALGGLAYAAWKVKEAEDAHVQAIKSAFDASEDLRAKTEELTSASWDRVPAIEAEIDALRRKAQAEREAALAERQRAADENKAIEDHPFGQLLLGTTALGGPSMTNVGAAGIGLLSRYYHNENTIRATDAAQAAAEARRTQDSLDTSAQESRDAQARAFNISHFLATGKGPDGRDLTDQQKEQFRRDAEQIATTQQSVYDWATQQTKIIDEKIRSLSGDPKSQAYQQAVKDRKAAGSAQSEASEAITSAQDSLDAGTHKPASTAKTKKVRTPGGVNQALNELTRQEYLPKGGAARFSLIDGKAIDSTTGAVFKARSNDESEAAKTYVRAVKDVNGATAEQIKLTGHSREELRQAASAQLDYAVANSKAAQAEDKFADLQAEMTGQSRAEVQARRQVQQLMDQMPGLSEKEAAAYKKMGEAVVAFVAAREKARRLASALQFDSPLVNAAFDVVTAGNRTPTDARGVLDVEKATKQIEDAKEKVILEAEARIRDKTHEQATLEGWTQEREEKELADRIAAVRTAVEMETASRVTKIRVDGAKEATAAQVQEAQRMSGKIVDALKEISHAKSLKDAGEIGKQLGEQILEDLLDELLYSPLKKQIEQAILDMMKPKSGGGGGGDPMSQLISAGINFLGGGGGGGGSGNFLGDGTNPANVDYAGQYRDGGLPGYAKGRIPHVKDGLFKGRGGPRDDANIVAISDREFIMNAEATGRYIHILEAMNNGVSGFANGGSPAPIAYAPGPATPLRSGDVKLVNTGPPLRATYEERPDGSMTIHLYEQVMRPAIKRAGQDGTLAASARQTPQPPRRR